MRKVGPYKRRLYTLVTIMLVLCFGLSCIGMTGFNGWSIYQSSLERLNKLEGSTKKKVKMIGNAELTKKEKAFQTSLIVAELLDSTEQDSVDTYVNCKMGEDSVYEGGNVAFFHYYSESVDQDSEIVFEEQTQLILYLDKYLSETEIATLHQVYQNTMDAVLVAEGSYQGLELVPSKIQVIAPREENQAKWLGKFHVIAEQDAVEYTELWEKECDSPEEKESRIKGNETVESNVFFAGKSDKKQAKASVGSENASNFFRTTRTGTLSLGGDCTLTYSYVASPFWLMVKQLWVVFAFLCVFYLMAAALIYYLIGRIVKKQEQMNWSQKMLTRAVAHELKTPLSIIKGYCEGLKFQEDPMKQKEYVETITSETMEMDRLVLDMLELSKLETAGYPMELEEIELRELVETVVSQYKSAYSEKKVHFTIEGTEENLFQGDLSCMHKVVSNLIGNAIKHAKENGQVKITVKKREKEIYFGVYNDGPQIQEETRKTIWDGFYQIQKENRSTIRSTGLGLTIVKYMLEMHGFTYGCDNCNLGVEFWVGIKI